MKGKWFWVVIALSSITAAILGYQRFKQIRPDLYDQPNTSATTESERAARIADYQRKGDALTRAATPRRKPEPGQICLDGLLADVQRSDPKIESEGKTKVEVKRVMENGKPVACEPESNQPLVP